MVKRVVKMVRRVIRISIEKEVEDVDLGRDKRELIEDKILKMKKQLLIK